MNRLSLLALLLATPSFATLSTWKECVEEASQSNSELQSARQSLQASIYSVNSSYGPFFPQVTGTANYSHNDGYQTSSVAIPGASNSRGTDNYALTLNASQNLFSGFQDKARVDQAKANSRISEENANLVKARVSYDLKANYAGLLYALDAVNLGNDIVHRREENLRLVELRYENGRENQGSVLLSKAYLDQARYDVTQSLHTVMTGKSELARVLGRNSDSDLEIENKIPLQEPPSTPHFEELVLSTPQYRQAIDQEQSAEASTVLARSAFFPSLNLTGAFGRQDDYWFPQNSRWSVGVSLTVPIFSGGRDYYAMKSSLSSLSAASATRSNVDRQILARLKQAHAAYVEAVAKQRVDESFLSAAKTRAEIARTKYNNGLLSFEDWDLIENDLINRQKTALQSKRDRIVAEAAWEQAIGKGAIQ